MLAYHWAQAGDAARALPYLLSAAERADRCFAHRERAHFYNEALRVSMSDGADAHSDAAAAAPALAAVTSPGGRRLSASVPSWQLAQWHYEVGRSEWSLGRLQKTTEELQRAMELLGRPNVAISDQREASVSGFLHLMASARRGSLGAASWQRKWFLLDETTLAFDALPEFHPVGTYALGVGADAELLPTNAREILLRVGDRIASAGRRSRRGAVDRRPHRRDRRRRWSRRRRRRRRGRRRRRRRRGRGGFLEKKSRRHGGYQRRWVVLDRARLDFREPPRFAPPTVIDLSTLIAPPKPTHPTALSKRATRAARRGRRRGRRRARGRARTFARDRRGSYTLAADTEAELGAGAAAHPRLAAANAAAAPATDAAAGGRRSLKVEGDDAPRPAARRACSSPRRRRRPRAQAHRRRVAHRRR